MVCIDKCQSDQRGAEQHIDNPGKAQIKFQVKQTADRTHQSFNEGIPYRNLLLAVPAAATKKDVAQNRNVVPIGYRLPALRATRPRLNDRFIERNSGNADVEETANSQPNHDTEEKNHRPRSIRNCLKKT